MGKAWALSANELTLLIVIVLRDLTTATPFARCSHPSLLVSWSGPRWAWLRALGLSLCSEHRTVLSSVVLGLFQAAQPVALELNLLLVLL